MTRFSIDILLVAFALSAPHLSFADGKSSPSHAALLDELGQLERAGYTPSENDPSYPAGLQLAEQRARQTSPAIAHSRNQSADDTSPIAKEDAPREVDAVH
jgi:Domain of unknown function (DUF4148)